MGVFLLMTPEDPLSITGRRWRFSGALPHDQTPGTTQFVTFRLSGSLPEAFMDAWRAKLAACRDDAERLVEAKRAYRFEFETSLDAGTGLCLLRDPRCAEAVQSALLYFHGDRYGLAAWVVMPNHVHALVDLAFGVTIENVMHSWKSHTARTLNRLTGNVGAVWQRGYFDRRIGDVRRRTAVVGYIENNPVKASLVERPEQWQYGSAAHELVDGRWRLTDIRRQSAL